MSKKKIEIDLYGEPTNNCVVRIPGRQNAGVVVQADTLANLVGDLRDLSERLKTGDDLDEIRDELDLLTADWSEVFENLRTELQNVGEVVKA